MLADPRAEAMATNFARQWLHLQNLRDLQPDAYQYPTYSKNLSESMLRETELFFQNMMREDRNILELLTADYTFVDELLARHYGIPNVSGSAFRRVALPEPNRRGLLGQASILTLTSVSNRTSPVGRGKYVLEVLLGTPPPPPPPDVPALKDDTASGNARVLSVRQQMEQHRAKEPCATCHKLMDPIGFSLENFDAVGAWRARDGGVRVDASGKMFDGADLSGPVSLREAILNRSDVFISSFTENLLAYGLGRLVDVNDMPAVRSIAVRAGANANRFSAFVLGIVKSSPFQMSVTEAARSGQRHRTLRDYCMFLTKKHISRRTMLRGLGVSVALPLLDSMVPAQTPLSKTAVAGKTRLACIEMVHGAAGSTAEGTEKHYWTPVKEGSDFAFTESLQPLEHLRDYLTIINRTDLKPAMAWTSQESGGDHFRSSATFLSACHPKMTEGSDIYCGTSIDQIYAQQFGQDTPLPSMQLCIEGMDESGACDFGYSCVYSGTISWASPTRPLPMERDPRQGVRESVR